MQVTIFKDLTTEDSLGLIEKESTKYQDIYADMDNPKERKAIKESASLINDLLKKLERARIDKSKEYKTQVEAEAKNIKERLEAANKPLTALIDAHKEKRAKELAAEKAIQDAKDLAIQIEEDHEDAITLDKIRTFEIQDEIRKQKERDEQIAKEASERAERERDQAEERAEQAEKDKILAEAKAKRDAEQAEIDKDEALELAARDAHQASLNAQLLADNAAEQAKQAEIQRQASEKAAQEEAQRKLEANKRHVGKVRGAAKASLMDICDLNESKAREIVLAISKGCIANITINY